MSESTLGYLLFALLGYLAGSVLPGYFLPRLLGKADTFDQSDDHNPGTANAFHFGGFGCGVATLLFDLVKGFGPVWFCAYYLGTDSLLFALVMLSPVLGHAFSCCHHFRGGKAIAAAFGVTLGLLPVVQPLLVLAISFIFFSVVVVISPNSRRTEVSFLVALAALALLPVPLVFTLGFGMISCVVLCKLKIQSTGEEHARVQLFGR